VGAGEKSDEIFLTQTSRLPFISNVMKRRQGEPYLTNVLTWPTLMEF